MTPKQTPLSPEAVRWLRGALTVLVDYCCDSVADDGSGQWTVDWKNDQPDYTALSNVLAERDGYCKDSIEREQSDGVRNVISHAADLLAGLVTD